MKHEPEHEQYTKASIAGAKDAAIESLLSLIQEILDDGEFYMSAIELRGVDGDEWQERAVKAVRSLQTASPSES